MKNKDFPESMSCLNDPAFRGSLCVSLVQAIKQNHVSQKTLVELCQKVYEHWKKMKEYPSGPDRAKFFQGVMSQLITHHFEQRSDTKVPCQKGCAHCCYQEVMILDDEAILYSKMIKSGLVTINRDRLKSQAKLKDYNEWKSVPQERRACVFLNGNECSIYEDRPLSCRKFFVQSSPESCSDIHGTSLVLMILNAEIFLSAALNLKPGPEALAKKLVEKGVL
jgi:Fe-S-cluster containining protein